VQRSCLKLIARECLGLYGSWPLPSGKIVRRSAEVTFL